MKIPQELLDLMKIEQAREFGPDVPLDEAYLDKLEKNAELIIHHFPHECAGFVFFYCNDPAKESSYITFVATAQDARRKGIGFSLVSHVLNISRRRGFKCCRLEVRKENAAAISLYESIGFVTVEDHGAKYLMSIEVQQPEAHDKEMKPKQF
jgi:ribosomal-protein-alanine N-acetyltransferase